MTNPALMSPQRQMEHRELWRDYLQRRGQVESGPGGYMIVGRKLVLTTTTIAARVGTPPSATSFSTGVCKVLTANGTAIEVKQDAAGADVEETVGNWVAADLPADTLHWAIQDEFGDWWITAQDYLCVEPGVGGMNTPSLSMDLTIDDVSWSPMLFLNSEPTNIGCVVDPATGQFTLQQGQIWEARIQFNATIVEAQAGRTMLLRAFETVGGTPSASLPIAVARNQPGLVYSQTLRIDPAVTGEVYRFELSMEVGESLTVVSWDAMAITITQIK